MAIPGRKPDTLRRVPVSLSFDEAQYEYLVRAATLRNVSVAALVREMVGDEMTAAEGLAEAEG